MTTIQVATSFQPKIQFQSDIPYEAGLESQERARLAVAVSPRSYYVLGFEHKPVVTMGVRASLNDLLSIKHLKELGFQVVDTDRGGQSTLHMPGQLVIYPVLNLPIYGLSVKRWICLLAQTSVRVFEEIGVPSFWDDEKPGVYTTRGKIMAVGVRIRRGTSQHGICINVHNSLEPFQWLVPCGVKGAPQDRLSSWGYQGGVEELFRKWQAAFEFSLTTL